MAIYLRPIVCMILFLSLSFAHAADIEKIEQKWSDAMITTKIKAQFAKHKNLNPLKISVTTDHGEVALKGHAKNKEAYVEALRIVTNTKDVRSIDTTSFDINVVNSSFTDAYITAKVETAILKSKVLDDESIPLVGINASTLNGVVTLTGEVKHQRSIQAMLNRAQQVRGVKKIISHLSVASINK